MQATKTAILLIRQAQQTRKAPIVLDTETGEYAIAVAARIFERQCRLTGEDPGTLLEEFDADT